jgi:hypothetical protein
VRPSAAADAGLSEEDIRDPRVAPRWLEVGITGVPRSRDWDVIRVIELPELERSELAEIAFDGLVGGAVSVRDEQRLPLPVLERLAAALEGELDPPYEAVAVRRGQLDWALAARSRRFEELALPPLDEVEMISVAVSPDGERTEYVEGAGSDDAVGRIADELERRGRERFDAFVATAERSASGWKLTIDPL